MKFAKLFEVPNETFGESQVLYFSEYDDEVDLYIVNVIADVNGIAATMRVKFDDELDANEFLENADQLAAEVQYRNICKMMLQEE